jgi:hypothetical protein
MSSALARFLSQRAKTLAPSALPAALAGEPDGFTSRPPVAFVPAPRVALREPAGDVTITWSDGEVHAERLVRGRKLVFRYSRNKN